MKHVESRWLTLSPALLWVVEQFDGLKQYFLLDVSAKQPSILHSKTYKKISDQIKCKDILTQIHFVAAVADIFNWFLVFFQIDKSLIHILHSECVLLVLPIVAIFLKQEVYAELGAKELHGTRIVRCNQLHDGDLLYGENCESAFDLLSSEHKSKILNGARSFYKASFRHLIKKFPLKSIMLQCLASWITYFWFISTRYLNTWQKLTAISVNVDKLIDEWNQ